MMRKFISKGLLLGFVLMFGAGSTLMAETREFTMINVKYEGKILWLPNTFIVKKGDHVKINLVNNVQDDPAVHGFSIPQFKVVASVERGKPQVVEFDATQAGLFETNCQLHPGHLHGQLLVLDK